MCERACLETSASIASFSDGRKRRVVGGFGRPWCGRSVRLGNDQNRSQEAASQGTQPPSSNACITLRRGLQGGIHFSVTFFFQSIVFCTNYNVSKYLFLRSRPKCTRMTAIATKIDSVYDSWSVRNHHYLGRPGRYSALPNPIRVTAIRFRQSKGPFDSIAPVVCDCFEPQIEMFL